MLPITRQIIYVLLMIALGALIGVAIDLYKLIFSWSKPKGVLAWLWDLSFWAVIFICVYYFLLLLIKGDFRLWVLLAMALGQFIYHKAWRVNKKILWLKGKVAGFIKRSANKK